MTDFEKIILNRRSVRTFEPKALPQDVLDGIENYAASLTNPWNIPCTFHLYDAKRFNLSSPVIVGAPYYLIGKCKNVPDFELAFGYTMQKITTFIEEIGLGTVFIGGTMKREPFEKAIDLQADEVMPCISPVGIPAKKMAIRETLMRQGVKADTRLPMGELFFEGSFKTPLAPQDEITQTALRLIRRAPSAVNKQPWRVLKDGSTYHFYEDKTLNSGAESGDMQKIDLGIAIACFTMVLDQYNVPYDIGFQDPKIADTGNKLYCAYVHIR